MDLSKLINDETFKDAIIQADSIYEIATLLRDRGIDVDEAELENILAQSQEGELDEFALEAVSGGSWLTSLCSYIYAVRYKAGGGGFSRGGGGKGAFGGGGGGGSR